MTGVFVVSLMSFAILAAVAIVAAVPNGAAVVRLCGVQVVRLSNSGWKIVTQSD